MAGEQLEDTNISLTIVNNLGKNDESNCQCCDTLKADIQKAKQDILSYREIIKIPLE
jgi:predicted methyltransferase